MNIGIIGAGNIGGALTHRFRAAGHNVKIANSRGPETLKDLAAETGATAVDVRDAVKDVDLVVMTIPQKHILELPRGLFEGLSEHVVVVDTGNYYPKQRDGRIEAIEGGLTESEWVQQQLGHPVLKAFNNIYADHLLNNGQAKGAAGRIALPVSGDSASQKQTLMKLIDEIGFDSVDNGTLSESWRQQPGTPVYGTDYDVAGVKKALNEASRQRTPDWSGTEQSPGDFSNPK